MEKTLEMVLHNALVALADETFERYIHADRWQEMMYEKLNCNKEELEALGIKVNEDGTVDVDYEKQMNSIKDHNDGFIKPLFAGINLYDVASAGIESFTFVPADAGKDIYPGNSVIFVNGAFSKIMLPNVYVVERILKDDGKRIFTFKKDVKINMLKEHILLNEFKK